MRKSMKVFGDSKTFVDMPMVEDPDEILLAFSNWTNRSKEGLLLFVNIWFNASGSDLTAWTPLDWQESPSILGKIENDRFKEWATDLNSIWKDLGKQVSESVTDFPEQHSLLPVEYPFIVPGGRFREFYYWDSYWIVRGLLLCGMNDTVKGMIRNLAQLINEYGMVPNGGRVYYTKRSQPPLLTWMLSDYYEATGDANLVGEVVPLLDKEYQFWMTNRSAFFPQCNCTVNLYASPVTSPRPESFREDVATGEIVPEADRPEVYSNLASAAESGWDFSSRWFQLPGNLSSIRTKNIIPVDLNSIIGINEILLQRLHALNGSKAESIKYSTAWQERKNHFNSVFWNENEGLWIDRVLDSGEYLPGFYASSLTPLYLWKINQTANTTRERILHQTLSKLGVLKYPGGLPTSLNTTSNQQWDFPNAWAPLQWFVVQAWFNSSNQLLKETANEIATKWLRSNYLGWLNYNRSMFEKYDCTVPGSPGKFGEYNAQLGFGWTNGIALDFLNLYPKSTPFEATSSSGFGTTDLILVSVFLSLFTCALCISVPCIYCCWWVYNDGRRRYWARVRDEQLIQSPSDPRSPSVFENPSATDWSDSDSEHRKIDL